MKQVIHQDYLIYKIRNSDCYAAVAPPYQRDIRQYALEYKCLSAVPGDRSVKAILIQARNNFICTTKQKRDEVMLPVNQLEFDTENLRLIR